MTIVLQKWLKRLYLSQKSDTPNEHNWNIEQIVSPKRGVFRWGSKNLCFSPWVASCFQFWSQLILRTKETSTKYVLCSVFCRIPSVFTFTFSFFNLFFSISVLPKAPSVRFSSDLFRGSGSTPCLVDYYMQCNGKEAPRCGGLSRGDVLEI